MVLYYNTCPRPPSVASSAPPLDPGPLARALSAGPHPNLTHSSSLKLVGLCMSLIRAAAGLTHHAAGTLTAVCSLIEQAFDFAVGQECRLCPRRCCPRFREETGCPPLKMEVVVESLCRTAVRKFDGFHFPRAGFRSTLTGLLPLEVQGENFVLRLCLELSQTHVVGLWCTAPTDPWGVPQKKKRSCSNKPPIFCL